MKKDNEPIPGGWSEWTSWTACSASCAGGSRVRERTCTKPAPRYGGPYCEGEGEDEEECNTDPCEPGKKIFFKRVFNTFDVLNNYY